jgi:hypothetical protein
MDQTRLLPLSLRELQILRLPPLFPLPVFKDVVDAVIALHALVCSIIAIVLH